MRDKFGLARFFFRGAADLLPRIDGFSVAPLVRAGIDLAQGAWERAGLGHAVRRIGPRVRGTPLPNVAPALPPDPARAGRFAEPSRFML